MLKIMLCMIARLRGNWPSIASEQSTTGLLFEIHRCLFVLLITVYTTARRRLTFVHNSERLTAINCLKSIAA
jgi:hypothetical protein